MFGRVRRRLWTAARSNDAPAAPGEGDATQNFGLSSRIVVEMATADGARGTRTPDLLGAIQALSQLSYSPMREPVGGARLGSLDGGDALGCGPMGDLDDAIREHLELKRRRGADPAEVAREEQEALAPVTRGHAVVVPEDLEQAEAHAAASPRNGDAQHTAHDAPHDTDRRHPPPTAPSQSEQASGARADEDLGDATQEFHVVHGDADDWLEDDDA